MRSPDGAERDPENERYIKNPDFGEPVIGRRFAPTRWLHPGYKVLNQPAALASLRRAVRMNSV